MPRLIFVLFSVSNIALLGCGGSLHSNDTGEAVIPSQEVQLTLVSWNGSPEIEIPVFSMFDHLSYSTEEDGTVLLLVEPHANFTLIASDEYSDSLQHHYYGIAGNEDFSMTAPFFDRNYLALLQEKVGITPEPGKGIILVSIVDGDFAPKVSAKADISSTSGNPAVLNNNPNELPLNANTNTIEEGDLSWILFGNVDTGPATVTVENTTACRVYPSGEISVSGTTSTSVTAYADTISYVQFQCQ